MRRKNIHRKDRSDGRSSSECSARLLQRRKDAEPGLDIFIPGGFDSFVQELSEPVPTHASDKDNLDAVRHKYGIQFVDENAA